MDVCDDSNVVLAETALIDGAQPETVLAVQLSSEFSTPPGRRIAFGPQMALSHPPKITPDKIRLRSEYVPRTADQVIYAPLATGCAINLPGGSVLHLRRESLKTSTGLGDEQVLAARWGASC